MNRTKLPTQSELVWGTFYVMRDLGRPASIKEINDQLAKDFCVTPETRRILHRGGPEFEFDYRTASSRTYLKRLGAIYRVSQAIWALTTTGQEDPIGRDLYQDLVTEYGPDPSSQGIKSVCKPKFPTDRELAWAILDALKDRRGRPIEKSAIPLLVAKKLSLSDKVIDWPHKDESVTELYYRIGWVLKKLKDLGAVENANYGYWAPTRDGEQFRGPGELYKKLLDLFGPELFFEGCKGCKVESRKHKLLESLHEIHFDSFEKICHELLLKSGFRLVGVTDRTKNSFEGNGVLRTDLLSFRVYFRFQRFNASINGADISQFRKSVNGHAEKGIFVTTSDFDDSARRVAERGGVPAIDLVSGSELCDYLIKFNLGL